MAKKKNSGFSLIEVVIAVAILGLLITPILTQIIQSTNTGRKAKERQAAVENAEYVMNFIQRTDKEELDIMSSSGVSDISITGFSKKTNADKVTCELVDVDGNLLTTVEYNAYIYTLDNTKLGPKSNEYTRKAILDDLSSCVLGKKDSADVNKRYEILYDSSAYSDSLKADGFILTNEGSITHTNSDGLVDKIVCVPSTGDYTKDYVNPNNVNIGFIQDLDATKVAIIQSVASNFDKQASDSIFTQKMDFLKATNPDEWKKQVTGITGTNTFSNDAPACRYIHISNTAHKNLSDKIDYYEVTCDVAYYDNFTVGGSGAEAKLKYTAFAKKFYTSKAPDVFFYYEPYVPDETDKYYTTNDFIEFYNDADTQNAKVYLLKPDKNQLEGTDYADVYTGGATPERQYICYNTEIAGNLVPVNINLSVSLKSGESIDAAVPGHKDVMTIYTNMSLNYEVDGKKMFSTDKNYIRTSGGGDDLTLAELNALRDYGKPATIASHEDLPSNKLVDIKNDTQSNDRLFTVTVVMDPVSGSMDSVRYTAGKGVD